MSGLGWEERVERQDGATRTCQDQNFVRSWNLMLRSKNQQHKVHIGKGIQVL